MMKFNKQEYKIGNNPKSFCPIKATLLKLGQRQQNKQIVF